MEENKDRELAEEFVTVPKGTTVNKEKYERAVAAKDAAEARMADLESQIAALTADKDSAASVIEELKAKTEQGRAAYEADMARKEKEIELLRAECIDPESGIASLKEGETIEQLKERKPHLFKQPTKQSSLAPKDQPRSADEALTDEIRKAFKL